MNGMSAAAFAEADATTAGGETARSRALWFASLALLAAGHVMMNFVDGMARNAWTLPACASILAGYMTMAASIGCRED
jgi:hypothetical protein